MRVTLAYRAAATALALVLLLAGCATGEAAIRQPLKPGSTSLSTADRLGYPSIAELAAASDLVVRATVGQLSDFTLDAVDNDAPRAPDVGYYEVDVVQVLAGEAPAQVLVEWAPANVECEGAPDRGTDVVLFLHDVSVALPGSDATPWPTQDGFYTTVGCTDGEFFVEGDTVRARSDLVTTLEKAEPVDEPARPPLVTTVSELARVAAEHLGN